MPTKPLRVLIVDDEPLARQRLEDLLRHEPGVQITGTAESGPTAVERIRALRPDLVFLDVQMPGMSGLDVVRTVGADAMPATVFVTAFDRHALEAFDLAAVDYLVKPFDDDRFEQAFRRARHLVELEDAGRLREQLLSVLHGEPGATTAPAAAGAPIQQSERPQPGAARAPSPDARSTPEYLERIAVEMKGKLRVVPVDQIDYITADGPYAELHTPERTYIIRETMQSLAERLDPHQFFRLHRSAIVRLSLVDTLLRGAGGDYEVQLRTGVRLPVSRARREELERKLGVV
ncbi:MAG TPA: LytTR family DNA-binding domain-containing protein [Gemmatimonadaceae bacterium]|nr:LytTR family DNA-binding domain-containing protein [Gemmatimonadaceae bacterium]